MDILKRISRGTSDLPPRVVLAGPEKIGKSTWASHAPNPLFICAEDGLSGLDHVQRFTPATADELFAMLDAILGLPKCDYKTIVLDTADWAERLLYTSLCARDGKKNIEEYGYGKGYNIGEAELVKLLQRFDAIRHKHKIGIIILSHVQVRTFNDPRGESWERYEMKGNKRFTGVLREWPEAVLFAVFEVFKTKKNGHDVASGGDRVICTEWSPAYDAGNRLNLPPTLPLQYEAFEQAIRDNSVSSLAARVRELYKSAKIPEAEKPKWEKAMAGLDTMTADRLQSAITKLEAMK